MAFVVAVSVIVTPVWLDGIDIGMFMMTVVFGRTGPDVVHDRVVVLVVTMAAPGQPVGLVDEQFTKVVRLVPVWVGTPAGIVIPAVSMASVIVTAAPVANDVWLLSSVIVEVEVPPAGPSVVGLLVFVSVTGVVTEKPLVAAVVVVFVPSLAVAVAPATDVPPVVTCALIVNVTVPATVTVPLTLQGLVLGVTTPPVAVVAQTALSTVTPDGMFTVNVPVPLPTAWGAVATYVIDAPPGRLPGFAGFCVRVGETVRSAFAPPHCEPRVARTARAARRTITRPNFLFPTV